MLKIKLYDEREEERERKKEERDRKKVEHFSEYAFIDDSGD